MTCGAERLRRSGRRGHPRRSGKALIKSILVGFFPPKFNWLGVFANGERIMVDVRKPGPHTIGLWMVEDGVRINQILITPDAAYNPGKH